VRAAAGRHGLPHLQQKGRSLIVQHHLIVTFFYRLLLQVT
jgi:hypothetical protein